MKGYLLEPFCVHDHLTLTSSCFELLILLSWFLTLYNILFIHIYSIYKYIYITR